MHRHLHINIGNCEAPTYFLRGPKSYEVRGRGTIQYNEVPARPLPAQSIPGCSGERRAPKNTDIRPSIYTHTQTHKPPAGPHVLYKKQKTDVYGVILAYIDSSPPLPDVRVCVWHAVLKT